MDRQEKGTAVGAGCTHNNNQAADCTVLGEDSGCTCTCHCKKPLGSGEGKTSCGEDSPQSSPPRHAPVNQALVSQAPVSSSSSNGSGLDSAERSDDKVLQDGQHDVVGQRDSDKGVSLEVTLHASTGHPVSDCGSCPAVSGSGQQVDADSSSQEAARMMTCSCDEATLCFCTTSAFCPQQTASTNHKQSVTKHEPHSKNMTSDLPEIENNEVFTKNEVVSINKESEGALPSVILEDEEDVRKCKSFMEDLVDRIFNNSASICQEDNAKFGEYCQTAIGRQWFARLIDNQRVNSKKVTEQTFYRLVQFFAVCLFECSFADDFTPGKSLMNMCFTFYHEHEGFPRSDDTTQKSYLFTHLMEQPIWKSLRFWDAAFFDAVHQERKQRAPDNQVNWRHLSSEERESTEILNENIAFGQLATFLHNMMELELSREMCQQFMDKMATIGNLSSDQRELIQSSLGNHFHDDIEDHSRHRRLQKPFNKLVFMKRKTRHESAS